MAVKLMYWYLLCLCVGYIFAVNRVVYIQDECQENDPIHVNLSLYSGPVHLRSQRSATYARWLRCTVFIHAAESRIVQVKTEWFEIYGNYQRTYYCDRWDNVRMYDASMTETSRGYPITQFMCGNLTGFPPIYSIKRTIQLDFKTLYTDGNQRKGFLFTAAEMDDDDEKLPIYMQKVCAKTNPYRVTDEMSGYIYSNTAPGLYYMDNMDCGIIVTVPSNWSLGFVIEWMDLPPEVHCSDKDDYLMFYSGESTVKNITEHLCWKGNSHTAIYSGVSQVFIRFHSNGVATENTGFVLRFFTYEPILVDNFNIGAIIGGSFLVLLLLVIVAVPTYYFHKRKQRQRAIRNQQVASRRQGAPPVVTNTTSRRHSAPEIHDATTQVARSNFATTSTITSFSRSTAPSIHNEFMLFLPVIPQNVHPASLLRTATHPTTTAATTTNIGSRTHATHRQPIRVDQTPYLIDSRAPEAPPSYESLFPNNN